MVDLLSWSPKPFLGCGCQACHLLLAYAVKEVENMATFVVLAKWTEKTAEARELIWVHSNTVKAVRNGISDNSMDERTWSNRG